MTRKDYVAIARAIYQTRQDRHDGVATMTLESVAERIATVMEVDNPRFDRERFIKACEADK